MTAGLGQLVAQPLAARLRSDEKKAFPGDGRRCLELRKKSLGAGVTGTNAADAPTSSPVARPMAAKRLPLGRPPTAFFQNSTARGLGKTIQSGGSEKARALASAETSTASNRNTELDPFHGLAPHDEIPGQPVVFSGHQHLHDVRSLK